MEESKTTRRCFFCNGQIKSVTIGNFDYRLEGRLFVLKGVPAGLCLQCGEKYISAEVAEKINNLVNEGGHSESLEVPVLVFDEAQVS